MKKYFILIFISICIYSCSESEAVDPRLEFLGNYSTSSMSLYYYEGTSLIYTEKNINSSVEIYNGSGINDITLDLSVSQLGYDIINGDRIGARLNGSVFTIDKDQSAYVNNLEEYYKSIITGTGSFVDSDMLILSLRDSVNIPNEDIYVIFEINGTLKSDTE